MRLTLALGASVLLLGLSQLPVRASSCAEQIGTIERRLDSAGMDLAAQVDCPGRSSPR